MATFLHEYFTLALAKNISEENVEAWSLNVFHFFMNDPNPIKKETIAIKNAVFD